MAVDCLDKFGFGVALSLSGVMASKVRWRSANIWGTKACVLIDEIGKAVGVNCGVDLLDDCTLKLVAHVEYCHFSK